MTGLWVMIVVTGMGWSGTNLATQEFSSRQACETAQTETADMIRRYGGGHSFGVRCVEK